MYLPFCRYFHSEKIHCQLTVYIGLVVFVREILRCSKNERCCSRELDTKIDTTEMLSQPELRNCS